MTTYEGVALGPGSCIGATRFNQSGGFFIGAGLAPQGSPAPAIERGGGRILAPAFATPDGRLDAAGFLYQARALGMEAITLVGFLASTGKVFEGRSFRVSAFYRQSDRITMAGYALDLNGNKLRQVQIQFVGETVQDHYFGAGTDLEGIYVAFLDVGDSYLAYAFNPVTGITYRLEEREELPNQINLVFRQVTKNAGLGEGIFLKGG